MKNPENERTAKKTVSQLSSLTSPLSEFVQNSSCCCRKVGTWMAARSQERSSA
jgi:hypothetical protein